MPTTTYEAEVTTVSELKYTTAQGIDAQVASTVLVKGLKTWSGVPLEIQLDGEIPVGTKFKVTLEQVN